MTHRLFATVFLVFGFVTCEFLTMGPAFAAGTPMLMNHQGVVRVNGEPFTGNGSFRFAIVLNSPGGTVNRWTNDGSQIGMDNMPDTPVTLPVNNGHYSVNLGDGTFGMMMIDGYLFQEDTLMALRIWFDDTVRGPQLLAPDQPLTTVPYAFCTQHADRAATVDADSVYGHHIVNGEVTSSKLRDGACLAEILDDDGHGSGLDADLLDGQHASEFAQSTHVHSAADIQSGTLANARYDAYGNLSANGKIGEASNQVAAGNHLHTDYWKTTGNFGTTPGTNFLGTTNNTALELKVYSQRALRIEPTATSPNLIGGYKDNVLTEGVLGATIGGGGRDTAVNRVTDDYGTIGGGQGNQAGNGAGTTNDKTHCTVGGGAQNTASGFCSTVGGGYGNGASGVQSTVGGGMQNTSSATYSTAGGGYRNTANGEGSTVPGGADNTASGKYSFAAGNNAKALHDGCFVWVDQYGTATDSTADNQFRVRSIGGVWFYSSTGDTGVRLAQGGGSWTSISDRNAKENFTPVDGGAVLEKVAALPISTWNYKTQDPAIRHIGPMAQDLYAAFGVGESETGITSVDADGVALAAIQGLNQRLEQRIEEKDQEIATLRAELESLKSLVQQIAGK